MTRPDYETYRKMMAAQQADAESLDAEAVENDEEYFTAEEIAAYLGVEIEEFHSRAGHGDLLPVQIEGQYVYAKKDVKRFLVNLGVIEGDSQW